MLENIQNCFSLDKMLYTKHAREEMEKEELGEVREKDVCDAILSGKIIESYLEDKPYPSCLVYGETSNDRPLHVVCAYDKESDIVIIITVYQPVSDQWIDFKRRKI